MDRPHARFPIRLKLLFLLLGVSGSIIVLFAIISTISGRKTTFTSAQRLLGTVRDVRASHVLTYLGSRESLALAVSRSAACEQSLFGTLGPTADLTNQAQGAGFVDVHLYSPSGSPLSSDKRTTPSPKLISALLAQSPGAKPLFEDYKPVGNKYVGYCGISVWRGPTRIGILVFELSGADLSRIATGGADYDPQVMGVSGETYLVGGDGRLRTPSRFAEYSSDGQTVGSVMMTEPIHSALGGQSGVMVAFGSGQRTVLSAYAPLNYRNLQWAIITEIDLDEAYAPVVEAQQQILLWTAGAVLAVALLSFVVSRQFVRPIVSLTQATSAFGRGEKVPKLEVKTNDEVAVLAKTFTRMLDAQDKAENTALSLRRNIVHDLKAPVTVIRGCAETLSQKDIQQDTALRDELLTSIVEQSDRLLEDLREIIMPVGDEWVPVCEEFDLAMLIQRAISAEKHTARAALHKFEVTGGEAPVMVSADRRKIRRVVENLLSNAVKYSPGVNKAVRIMIGEDANQVTVRFQDEGIGLSSQELEQVMNETGRVVDSALGIEGSGFGLDSCRHVLEAHGGTLLGKSEKGKGSEFSFTIPRRPQDAL